MSELPLNNKRKLKNALLNLLRILGIFHVVRWVNRHRVLIAVVHGVADDTVASAWKPLRQPLDLNVFRRQIEIISRHYNLVTYDEAVEMIAGRAPIVANSVAISFDDGYLNNLSFALPVLELHNMKPIFFVATAFANSKKTFWFDRFDYVIQQIQEDVELSIGRKTFVFEAGDRKSLASAYSEFRSAAKNADWSDADFTHFFDEICERLEKSSGKALSDIQGNDITSATLSDTDMSELTRTNRATIGSHTVDHVRLDRESSEQCVDQLQRSKSLIEAVIGANCDHFCYPNGGVDPMSRNLVEAAGYKSACVSEPGFNNVGDDLYLLKRVHLPSSDNATRLLSLFSGTAGLISGITAVFRR